MTVSTNKTLPIHNDVADFLTKIADPAQQADTQKIAVLLQEITGASPVLWGPSIIGFGTYHYRYESGRKGDWMRIGLSPRKGKTVLYLVDGLDEHGDILARLGKYKAGKACIEIKRLSDVDTDVLTELCVASWTHLARLYPL